MKKLYLLLLLFVCWAPPGRAQRSTSTTQVVIGGGGGTPTPTPASRWRERADSIFQYLDRSPVSTGLLANYGCAFKNYNLFQGTALAANNRLQNWASGGCSTGPCRPAFSTRTPRCRR